MARVGAFTQDRVFLHLPHLLHRLLELHSPLPADQQPGGASYTWLAERVLFALHDAYDPAMDSEEYAAWLDVNPALPLTALLATIAKKAMVNEMW